MLRLFNTLTRKKEDIEEALGKKSGDTIGLYTCGPTVYNYAHIGNLRTYIFEDILERVLKYDGYKVKRVMNITDVGHLTGDSDTGEDKMEKEAALEKKTPAEIANFYTKAFFDDLKKLNIEIPETITPATEYIPQQIELIQALFDKGFAYDTKTAVYFDVSKFPAYGTLSGQSLADKSIGAREEVVLDKEKRNPQDFALWFKLMGKFEHHLLHWPSPWGEGFPGWHIECSAISRHFLGQPFDIHTGGVDHIGTHHTNEIAQSEAAYGVPLANIWLHGEHLVMNEMKMAKSKGDFITLSELEKKGYSPLVYRYFVLQAHYRTQLNFTWESLNAARARLNFIFREINLRARYKQIYTGKNPKMPLEKYSEQFQKAISDDLGTPKAIATAGEMLADDNNNDQTLKLVMQFDRVLGLGLDIALNDKPEESPQIKEKMELFGKLTTEKNFDESDKLRYELAKNDALSAGTMATLTGPIPYIVRDYFPDPNKKV